MPDESPSTLVLDILQDGWTAGNTFGQTPDIHFGWFNEDSTVPQVTVGQPEESPVDGGTTGYNSITQDGSPGQEVDGTVEVNVWARRGDMGSSTTTNPRQYNYQATEEIQRLCEANANAPTNPDTGNQPVDHIAYLGRQPQPDTNRTPTVFRYIVPVGYGYRD